MGYLPYQLVSRISSINSMCFFLKVWSDSLSSKDHIWSKVANLSRPLEPTGCEVETCVSKNQHTLCSYRNSQSWPIKIKTSTNQITLILSLYSYPKANILQTPRFLFKNNPRYTFGIGGSFIGSASCYGTFLWLWGEVSLGGMWVDGGGCPGGWRASRLEQWTHSRRIQICPKNPGFPPYNPILGMGCFDHQSYEFSGGVWILRHYIFDFLYHPMSHLGWLIHRDPYKYTQLINAYPYRVEVISPPQRSTRKKIYLKQTTESQE